MKKSTYVLIIVLFLVLLFVLIASEQVFERNVVIFYVNSIGTIIAGIGLIAIARQFTQDKNISEAQFVLDINNNFVKDPKIRDIYIKLENDKNIFEKIKDDVISPIELIRDSELEKDDLIDIANYLSFFSPLAGLEHRNVVDFRDIDIIAYRFFLVVHNPVVQDWLLCNDEKARYYENLFILHKRWRKSRKSRGKEIEILNRFDLSKKRVLYQKYSENDPC